MTPNIKNTIMCSSPSFLLQHDHFSNASERGGGAHDDSENCRHFTQRKNENTETMKQKKVSLKTNENVDERNNKKAHPTISPLSFTIFRKVKKSILPK